jgi:hypothetical protein
MWFVSCVLTLIGIGQIIQGLTALISPSYYAVDHHHLLLRANYTAWGWIQLGLGVLAFAVVTGLYTARTWARVLGVLFASVSALGQMAFLASEPGWAVALLALDVLVIYAIVVHGGEMRGA